MFNGWASCFTPVEGQPQFETEHVTYFNYPYDLLDKTIDDTYRDIGQIVNVMETDLATGLTLVHKFAEYGTQDIFRLRGSNSELA
ncbi:hypothetical protein JCM19233_7115 [Vibrio astriarenae]|nr:hypothetical protein JCM19233_7115 [Vibrio sp. C7]